MDEQTSMDQMTDVAFLGTGTMGMPMARNLIQAGHSVRAWNRSTDRAAPLAEAGAVVLDDPGEAAAGCGIVITMLSDADAVLAVAEQALSNAESGTVWLQMSTIGIDGTERCQRLAAERDVTFVDAPVLGTRAPAENGELIILASGPTEALKQVAELFAALGSRTLELGEAGIGSRLKVLVNGWLVGLVTVLAEVIRLARALDVDPDQFLAAIDGGPLGAPYAKLKGKAMIAESFDDVSFRLALARKDGDLLLSAASSHGLLLEVMAAAVDRFRTAEAGGHADQDLAAVYFGVGDKPGE